MHCRPFLITVALVASLSAPGAWGAQPLPGLVARDELVRAYDAILNADFDAVPEHLGRACVTVPVWCDVVETVSLWWQIALAPDETRLDEPFRRSAEHAIEAADEWTTREPQRAEAWFALGAAVGARAQWRVLRGDHLTAARDGKRIKDALERAIELDPSLHDAKFGVGMYRYYASVGPSALRLLRWLLLLPGGDRHGGLQQMEHAGDRGDVIQGEADYQLHLVYLWYENRSHDALGLIMSLQQRYPRNPLFPLIEAKIHDVYFHDHERSERVLRTLIARAIDDEVNEGDVALRRARASLNALHARAQR